MLQFKPIIPITMLILMAFVVTGYGVASELSFYKVDEAIAAKKKNPRTIYVDTRREEDFKTIRIPSSINIPIHFIKSKSYLKDVDIILINQGYSLSLLRQEGELLKSKGYRVAILVGGIAAWHQKGQRLEGDQFSVHTLHYISADELLSEADNPFVKMTVNIAPVPERGKITEDSLYLPVNSVNDLALLVENIESRGLDERAGVLIFDEKGDYSLVETLSKQCRPTIFFLNGGFEEYQLKTEQHQAMIQPKDKRMKTVGACPTCPSASQIDKKEENQ